MCASLRKVPKSLIPESSSSPPESVGCSFAADVMNRERQKILVVREYVSSLTRAAILPSEKHEDIRSAVISLIHDIIPLEGPHAIVRTDNAPGFQPLVNDQLLESNRIHIDLGRIKNKNRNPVAERAIQELESEILRFVRSSGPVAPLTLSKITASLNNRIRSDGLSAREIFYQRDQFTNEQIPLRDRDVILAKHGRALANHRHSEISKSGGAPMLPEAEVYVGDLVYLYSDRDKNSPRSRYLVTSIDEKWCFVRKFVGESLRANSYKVKLHEVYKVPSDSSLALTRHKPLAETSDSEEDYSTDRSHAPAMVDLPSPPALPDTPPPIPISSPSPLSQSASVPPASSCEVVTTNTVSAGQSPGLHIPEPIHQQRPVRAPSPPLSQGTLPVASTSVQPQPSVPTELSAPVSSVAGFSSELPSQPRRYPSRDRRRPKRFDDYSCE